MPDICRAKMRSEAGDGDERATCYGQACDAARRGAARDSVEARGVLRGCCCALQGSNACGRGHDLRHLRLKRAGDPLIPAEVARWRGSRADADAELRSGIRIAQREGGAAPSAAGVIERHASASTADQRRIPAMASAHPV